MSFAVVHGDAWANSTVINTISKYYGFADNGFADLMFLHCDGYVAHKQSDCRTYDDSGPMRIDIPSEKKVIILGIRITFIMIR